MNNHAIGCPGPCRAGGAVSTAGPGPYVLPCAWLQGIPVGTESSLVCFFLNRLAVYLRALHLDTARLRQNCDFSEMANTHALELRAEGRLTVGLLLAGVALLARVLLLRRRVALRGRRALVGLLLLAVLRASCGEGRRGGN